MTGAVMSGKNRLKNPGDVRLKKHMEHVHRWVETKDGRVGPEGSFEGVADKKFCVCMIRAKAGELIGPDFAKRYGIKRIEDVTNALLRSGDAE